MKSQLAEPDVAPPAVFLALRRPEKGSSVAGLLDGESGTVVVEAVRKDANADDSVVEKRG